MKLSTVTLFGEGDLSTNHSTFPRITESVTVTDRNIQSRIELNDEARATVTSLVLSLSPTDQQIVRTPFEDPRFNFPGLTRGANYTLTSVITADTFTDVRENTFSMLPGLLRYFTQEVLDDGTIQMRFTADGVGQWVLYEICELENTDLIISTGFVQFSENEFSLFLDQQFEGKIVKVKVSAVKIGNPAEALIGRVRVTNMTIEQVEDSATILYSTSTDVYNRIEVSLNDDPQPGKRTFNSTEPILVDSIKCNQEQFFTLTPYFDNYEGIRLIGHFVLAPCVLMDNITHELVVDFSRSTVKLSMTVKVKGVVPRLLVDLEPGGSASDKDISKYSGQTKLT